MLRKNVLFTRCWIVLTTAGKSVVPFEYCKDISALRYFLDGDILDGERPKLTEGWYARGPEKKAYWDCTNYFGPYENQGRARKARERLTN